MPEMWMCLLRTYEQTFHLLIKMNKHVADAFEYDSHTRDTHTQPELELKAGSH